MELLTQKVLESDWLMSAKNMNLKQCIKHYDEIINNNYANDKKRSTSNNDVLITHTYTNEEANNFFTNLDDLDL